MFDYKHAKLGTTRLGAKLHLFRKECESHESDLESLFLSLPRGLTLDAGARALLEKYEAIQGKEALSYEMEGVLLGQDKNASDPCLFLSRGQVE